jgi:UDP-N-acetylmuramyl tripeptide synthase
VENQSAGPGEGGGGREQADRRGLPGRGARQRRGDRRPGGAEGRPDLLARLTAGREVVLVSATNGKTTTTRLIAEALRAAGPVASNALGANMPAGITAAMAGDRAAEFAVIEVDEKYLPGVTRQTTPKAIALLNLSRDQLDRAAETRMMAQKLARGLADTGRPTPR